MIYETAPRAVINPISIIKSTLIYFIFSQSDKRALCCRSDTKGVSITSKGAKRDSGIKRKRQNCQWKIVCSQRFTVFATADWEEFDCIAYSVQTSRLGVQNYKPISKRRTRLKRWNKYVNSLINPIKEILSTFTYLLYLQRTYQCC